MAHFGIAIKFIMYEIRVLNYLDANLKYDTITSFCIQQKANYFYQL